MKRVSSSKGWGGFYLIGGHGAKRLLRPTRLRETLASRPCRRHREQQASSRSAACRRSARPAETGCGRHIAASVRSPANSAAAMTKPHAAAIPIRDVNDAALGQRHDREHGGGMKQQHRGSRRQPRGVGLVRGSRRQDDAVGAHDAGQDDQNAKQPGRLIGCARRAGAPWRRAIPACRRRCARMSPKRPERRRDVWQARPRCRRCAAPVRQASPDRPW